MDDEAPIMSSATPRTRVWFSLKEASRCEDIAGRHRGGDASTRCSQPCVRSFSWVLFQGRACHGPSALSGVISKDFFVLIRPALHGTSRSQQMDKSTTLVAGELCWPWPCSILGHLRSSNGRLHIRHPSQPDDGVWAKKCACIVPFNSSICRTSSGDS